MELMVIFVILIILLFFTQTSNVAMGAIGHTGGAIGPFNKKYFMQKQYTPTIYIPSKYKFNLPALNLKRSNVVSDYNIIEEHMIRYTTLDKNIRFGGVLDYSILHIIASDQHNIWDIGDIAQTRCTIHIRCEDYPTEVCIRHIMSCYNISNYSIGTGDDIYCVLGKASALRGYLRRVQQNYHLVMISKVNGGNYFKTIDERPFYIMHPYYTKTFIEAQPLTSKSSLANATLSHVSKDLYLPSIKVPVVLLCSDDIPIDQILKYNTQLPPVEVAHIITPIPIHKDLIKLHEALKLYYEP